MKFTGHVSCAVIAATPLIYYRSHLPFSLNPEHLSNYELLMWTGFWGVIPDIDIILQRYLPIKHRGIWTHSLWSSLFFPGLILLYFLISNYGQVPLPRFAFLTPFTVILAFFGIFMHVIGDSITKSGVPLLYAKQKWHFPIIGGHATFDNPILNLIPLAIAGALIYSLFGFKPETLKRFGKFDHYKRFFIQETNSEESPTQEPKEKQAEP